MTCLGRAASDFPCGSIVLNGAGATRTVTSACEVSTYGVMDAYFESAFRTDGEIYLATVLANGGQGSVNYHEQLAHRSEGRIP